MVQKSDRAESLRRIDWLLHRFGLVRTRLQPYFFQQMMLDDLDGPLPGIIASMDHHSQKIAEALTETKEELLIGGMDPELIAGHLEALDPVAELYHENIDGLDEAQESAREAFRRRFPGLS